MKKMLVVHNSMRGPTSLTTQLTRYFLDVLKSERSDIQVEELDLLTNKWGTTEPLSEGASYKSAAEYVLTFDYLLIPTTLYNFTVTAVLKNFMDHICVIGTTVRYTPQGPVGNLKSKYVTLAVRGGIYNGEKSEGAFDLPLINAVIGDFLGAKQAGSLIAEGVSLKDEAGKSIFSAATWIKENEAQIRQIVKSL